MSAETRSALLGVLVVVCGWAGWSALHAGEAPAAELTQASAVAVAPPPRQSEVAVRVATTPASSSPLPAAREGTPALREGFVLEHGMVTAIRSPVVPNQVTVVPPPVGALPPGVRPEDAEMSPGGIMAVRRLAPSTPSGVLVDEAAPNPFGPPTHTHAQ